MAPIPVSELSDYEEMFEDAYDLSKKPGERFRSPEHSKLGLALAEVIAKYQDNFIIRDNIAKQLRA